MTVRYHRRKITSRHFGTDAERSALSAKRRRRQADAVAGDWSLLRTTSRAQVTLLHLTRARVSL